MEPVKAILSIPVCEAIAAPTVGPNPGKMLTTPGGNPACQGRGEGERAQLSESCGDQGPGATHVPGAPYLLNEGAQVEGSEWGLLGRLEDHRVATAKGWCDLPCKHQEGEVPLCKQNAFVVS